MPATLTEDLPASKSSKHSAMQFTPATTARGGLLVIDTDRARVEYLVVELSTRGGRHFHFAKTTAGTDKSSTGEDVFVCSGSPRHQCSCRGFTATRNCKHLAAALSLISNQWM